MPEENVLLGLVGDVLIDRKNPNEVFSDVADILQAPDVLFGNLESAYSDDPQPAPSGDSWLYPPFHNLDAVTAAGFDVMSMANNHICDAGWAAMLETRRRLNSKGVLTCGAGEDLAAARKPAIIEVGGLKLAFLAYASTFPYGYEARENVPGLAPFRAHEIWKDRFDSYRSPGVSPRTLTLPYEIDLAHLKQDIDVARSLADLVVTSFHWGDYQRPFHLTDHEKRTARWCIDSRVDLVVGHHHHALRGMEWYKGKPIMYGLGHFVFDLKENLMSTWSNELHAGSDDLPAEQKEFDMAPREGWPRLPMHPDARMTAVAWAKLDRSGVSEIGFLPCRLTPDGLVHAFDVSTSEGKEVVDYVLKGVRSQNLNGRMDPKGAISLAGRKTVKVVDAS